MTGGAFQVVNDEPQFVRNKFLEGEPNKSNFPGPFQGLTSKQQQQYLQQQQIAVNNYKDIAAEPLRNQAELYPMYNSAGFKDCENYGFPNGSPNGSPNGIPNTFPPVIKQRSQGPANAEGPLWTNAIKRENFGNNNLDDFRDPSITNPCNQTGFGVIVPKFAEMPPGINAWTPSSNPTTKFMKCSEEGNPLTDIENRPVEQFSHNNMVPYYGSKMTQNMSSTGVSQAGDNNSCKGLTNGMADVTPWRDKLQTFTGCDEMYMHKRETAPMFSPAEQQTGWVFGTPAFRPDLERYKESLHLRTMESPVEKIRVGPGLALDYSVPAQGGFQQFTRILPNNVNDYKANQLEGRVSGGKWGINHPTSQYIHGVNKDKPDLTITQARRPTMRTKFFTNSPEGGDSRLTDFTQAANRGRQTREDTEQGAGFGQLIFKPTNLINSRNNSQKEIDFKEYFTGTFADNSTCISFGDAPVGRIMGSTVPMPTQDLQSYTNIRETFKRGEAEYSNGTYKECLDSSQGANKWGIIMGPATGGVSEGIPRADIYVNYTDRGDINPYIINATGTAQSNGVWNPNSFQDQQKTTTKETTLFSNAGNPSAGGKVYNNTWVDNPKVTTQETTQFAYQGNPSDNKGQFQNTWSDDPKVTRKETTDYSHSGNVGSYVANITDRSMFVGSTFFPVK